MSTAATIPGAGEGRAAGSWILAVGAVVSAAQLALVGGAGTDVPFMEQWDLEGGVLYPKWRDGTLGWADVLAAHNEHRILWTKLLALGLFILTGQWDPLLQLAVNALLKGAAFGALAGFLFATTARAMRPWVAGLVVLAGTMPAAWHNALWGFQSQVYFALLFSFLALVALVPEQPGGWRRGAGGLAGVAALLAMGAGAFTAVALLALAGLRWIERRGAGDGAPVFRTAAPALGLAILAWALRGTAAEHAELAARDPATLLAALGRCLAWPHTGVPVAALVMNLPAIALIAWRIRRTFPHREASDAWVALWCWGAAAGAAMAWTRGAGDEFALGVPSRYADFLVLLPLANAGCCVLLVRALAKTWNAPARRWRLAAVGWGVFAAVGWLGLSAEAWRRVISPRIQDREAPVRLLLEFVTAGGDGRAWAGQPRLLVPHPTPPVVWGVIQDERLLGRLPPSLQPGTESGLGSEAVRWVLGDRG